MQRVHLIGVSGSGKSTLARQLSLRLGLPHLELDSVQHQAGWVPVDVGIFRSKVQAFSAGDRWVICGNYSQVRDLIWDRVDTVIWLDLPKWQIAWRILMRSLRRVIFRIELWNGNRETWRTLLSLDPEVSVLLWAMIQYEKYRKMYEEEMGRLEAIGINIVHLRSTAEVTRWFGRI